VKRNNIHCPTHELVHWERTIRWRHGRFIISGIAPIEQGNLSTKIIKIEADRVFVDTLEVRPPIGLTLRCLVIEPSLHITKERSTNNIISWQYKGWSHIHQHQHIHSTSYLYSCLLRTIANQPLPWVERNAESLSLSCHSDLPMSIK